MDVRNNEYLPGRLTFEICMSKFDEYISVTPSGIFPSSSRPAAAAASSVQPMAKRNHPAVGHIIRTPPTSCSRCNPLFYGQQELHAPPCTLSAHRAACGVQDAEDRDRGVWLCYVVLLTSSRRTDRASGCRPSQVPARHEASAGIALK